MLLVLVHDMGLNLQLFQWQGMGFTEASGQHLVEAALRHPLLMELMDLLEGE